MSAEVPNAQVEVPHTVLFVLGKNIGEEWTGDRIRRTPGHVSLHSDNGVTAAGIALEEGLVDEVRFTITNTAGSRPLSHEEALASHDLENEGKPPKAEAEYMYEEFQRQFPHLSDRASIQPGSWDTNTDAKVIKKLKNTGAIKPESRVVVMSPGFHIPRVSNLFRRIGIQPYFFVTERILALRDPQKAKEYVESDIYQREKKKEDVVRFIQSLPFAAEFITFVTKRTRTN